ncbi:MAG: insulinase family protein [Myxococcales bacterium]|nr:insulinase family protein [Myxococcales bacterium]
MSAGALAATAELDHARHEHALPNGLRVIVLPRVGLHGAVASLFVKCGSRFELPSDNGLSHVLEHMLFRGTDRHPSAPALNLAIEDLGAHVDASTNVDVTTFEVLAPRETVLDALEVFAEVFRSPRFEGLAIEKQVLRAELEDDVDEAGRSLDPADLAREQLFPGHGLAQLVGGSLRNVARFGVEDLRRHLARFYVARNAVLVLAGDLSVDAALASAERAFGDWTSGDAAVVEAPATSARRPYVHVPDEGGLQSDLCLAWRTCGVNDAGASALRVFERLVDDGLASPLHRRLVDEKGLAYDVSAGADLFEDVGAFDVAATVAHRDAPALVREALALVSELASASVSAAELDRVRRRYGWSTRALLDQPRELASFYGTARLFGRDEVLAENVARFFDVSAEQARDAAARFAGSPPSLACVGDLPRTIDRQLRALVR